MKTRLLFSLLILLPLIAAADGYWLQVEGTGKPGQPARVCIYYGGVDDNSTRYIKKAKELDKLAGFSLFALDADGKKTDITISRLSDHWEGTFTPDKPGSYHIRAIHESLPVVERNQSPGKDIRPIQYLCTQYQVGAQKSAPPIVQPFELHLDQTGSIVNIQAFIGGKPAAQDTKLRIFNPENWEKLPVTDSSGKAFFIPTLKGMYIIRVDWVDKRPGQYLGKSYDSIRHRCDYTFYYQ